jgi:hypothetical protein
VKRPPPGESPPEASGERLVRVGWTERHLVRLSPLRAPQHCRCERHGQRHYDGCAKIVAIHEVGHSLGIAYYSNCNSIMYTNPAACAAAVTSCDAQAAAELYPY